MFLSDIVEGKSFFDYKWLDSGSLDFWDMIEKEFDKWFEGVFVIIVISISADVLLKDGVV
jgi:hypothetical protein